MSDEERNDVRNMLAAFAVGSMQGFGGLVAKAMAQNDEAQAKETADEIARAAVLIADTTLAKLEQTK